MGSVDVLNLGRSRRTLMQPRKRNQKRFPLMKLLRLVEQFASVDLWDSIISKLLGKSSESFQECYLQL